MMPKIPLLTLALATAVLAIPDAASPVQDAAANCYQIDGVDDCFNPCMEVAAVYNTARHEAGLEEKTPDAHCPA